MKLFRFPVETLSIYVLSALLTLLLIGSSTVVLAQSTTGSIGGHVTDASGAVISGAEIKITEVDKGLVTTLQTNHAGDYDALALPPGRYTVVASRQGFSTQAVEAFKLDIDQKARVDLTLSPGSVSQTVTVTGTAELMQTETVETGQVIGSKMILDLPLLGRDFLNLVALVPGTSSGGGGNANNISVSGQREEGNSIELNGIEIQGNRNNDTTLRPSVDAIQEFKVLTSDYAPEYGRASGGVLLIQTKPGTNNFHGDVYEFFRPNNTAANPALTPAGVEPVLKQHNFGFTFGGPLIRDKAFFFVSYEGTRERNHFAYLDTVPPSNQINYLPNGDVDLSGLTDPYTGNQDPIFDPFFFENNYYAQQFPGNIIPAADVSPAGKAILQQLFPAAQNNTFFTNYTAIQPYNFTSDDGSVRFDYTFSQRDRAYLTYDIHQSNVFSGDPFTGGIPIPGGGGADSGNREYIESDTVGLIYDHTFSPNLLNEVHASYFMTPYHQNSLVDGTNLASKFGIANANIPGFPQTYGFPQIQFQSGDITGGSTFEPLDFRDHNIQLGDQVTWVHGKHDFKFGYEYRHLSSTPDFSLFPVPYEYFGGPYVALTSDPTYTYYDPNAYYANGGSEVADLLLGLPYLVDQGLQYTVAHTTSNEHTFYIQDFWKVTNRLSLTYGVRYEYQQPYVEAHNSASNFDPATVSMLLAGRGGNSRSLVNSDKNNFAPRLGFVYQVTPKTVVRAGFGMFYSPENDAKEDLLTKNYPFFFQQQFVNTPYDLNYFLDSGVARPTSISIPSGASSISLAGAGASTQTVYYEHPDLPTGYTENYNLTVQQLLTPHLSLEASYVGAGSRKLSYSIGNSNYNSAISPDVGVVQTLTDYGMSNYNSLQVKLRKDFSHGVDFIASYTWAKTLDNGPGPFDIGAGSYPQNPFDLDAEYAPANYDRRNSFVAGATMEVPVGHGRWLLPSAQGATQTILGGWQFNTIVTLQTGTPVNIVLTTPPASGATIRPNIVPGSHPNDGPHTVAEWFNTADFTNLASHQTYGTSPRNPIYGPGFNNADLSLFKDFGLPREFKLQFRAEAFNALNVAHYDNPSATLRSGNFGKILGGYDGRVMQFGAKVIF
jgi:outer membrane receptor protein involved in Fe transport